MKKVVLLFVGFLAIHFTAFAQTVDLSYYLPKNVSYDPKIPTPKQVLGYEVGEWHVTHDQLVMYMREVAKASNRITIEEYGRTYEHRPLLLLTITSPENQGNIEQIRTNHLKLSDPNNSSSVNTTNMPSIVWMAYSVHGNEPSGANAALLVVYHMAAAQGAEIDNALKNTVVLLDPAINPDGIQRFSTWVNSNRSKNLVTDNNSREFSETWPGGRTNHYWFDLNRDWMPVQHNESRGRILKFQKWRPNILTDHHEMGTNATYFFQPGIPSRNHPLTPKKNFELTDKIAGFHADYLNEIGSFYYTKESFDDFYYGKGSTYPDIQGSIGILFEQASSRGHAQDSDNGVLTFPFTIRNQFITSLSTWKAGVDMRVELLNYQRDFFRDMQNTAKTDPIKGYVFGNGLSKAVSYHLIDILLHHDIDVYQLARNTNIKGTAFEQNQSFVVPMDQRQYGLIKGMFEKRTQFTDSLFYDVSSWTMPLAFNLPYEELSATAGLLGTKVTTAQKPMGVVNGGKSGYAYLFEWNEYYAPKLLNELLSAGLRAQVGRKPFTIKTATGDKAFDYGTIMVPIQNQNLTSDQIFALINKVATQTGIEVFSAPTGFSLSGIDLGSPNFRPLRKPEILIVTGPGTNGNDTGEIWHLLDQRFDIIATLGDVSVLSRDLSRYNVIVMPTGGYGGVNQAGETELKRWVRNGGTLIAFSEAIRWLGTKDFPTPKFKENSLDVTGFIPYANQENITGAQSLGGAIFNARIDRTHPIGYGYRQNNIAIFKSGRSFMEVSKSSFATPISFTNSPLISGYISKQNLDVMKGSAVVVNNAMGRGQVIAINSNTNFRAFWFGTNKIFLNAIFFGHVIGASFGGDGEE